MREFDRPRHTLVWRVLESLDESLLSATKCYFGGGTRIVMELDEYRESIDVDFLCRADEQTIRKRVRETLEICMPGGGYCLGTGNSVANYIPIDNYLVMLDEGAKFRP